MNWTIQYNNVERVWEAVGTQRELRLNDPHCNRLKSTYFQSRTEQFLKYSDAHDFIQLSLSKDGGTYTPPPGIEAVVKSKEG